MQATVITVSFSRLVTRMDTPTEQKPPIPKMKFTPGDYMFLGFMVFVLMAVVWVGILAHEEAAKTEESKHNGEVLVTWLTEAGTKRANPDFEEGPCAAGLHVVDHLPAASANVASEAAPAAAPASEAKAEPASADVAEGSEVPAPPKEAAKAPNTWGACLEHMFTRKEFKEMVNPFTEERPNFVAACVPTDSTLPGAFVIEKLVPTPPGSSVPYIASQLIDTDSIESKLQLRISVCDKGSYAIKIAEFEF
jgi:hypothetical protein